jgi:iron-sulfur cluster assembly 2
LNYCVIVLVIFSTFVADNDQHNSNCSLICDKISWSFLKDARLDYSKELIGSTFQIIDNPIAGTGCGCGVSFELKAQPDVEKTK